MIGLCLVLLLGGAETGAQPGPVQDPAALRIHRAVVVPADACEGELPDEQDPAMKGPVVPADGSLAGDVILRKAKVLPTPEPSKEL